MTINEILISKNMMKYRLSKLGDISCAMLSDICSRKTTITKYSAETIYHLAKSFDVSMEELHKKHWNPRKNI